jgi:hypothetical protein
MGTERGPGRFGQEECFELYASWVLGKVCKLHNFACLQTVKQRGRRMRTRR